MQLGHNLVLCLGGNDAFAAVVLVHRRKVEPGVAARRARGPCMRAQVLGAVSMEGAPPPTPPAVFVPALEAVHIVKDIRQQKVEQRPQFGEVVLVRAVRATGIVGPAPCARQGEAL